VNPLHWVSTYWDWAGSNIGAMPACGAIALGVGAPVTYLLRDQIGRRLAAWWAKHHGPHAIAQHLEALRQHDAEKAGRTA
jgi:hypothetical protein